MSLLRATNQQNQPQNQQQQNNPPAPPPPPRPSPFGRRSAAKKEDDNNEVVSVITPLERTSVRFELRGLGDPFYRILGHDMTPEYDNIRKLTAALAEENENTAALLEKLEAQWASFNLKGAMLMYFMDGDMRRTLRKPTPMPDPKKSLPDWLGGDDDDDDNAKQPVAVAELTALRAIDAALVLNVLARARSQVLLAEAPPVMATSYLSRSIVTDDPRLVAIARATGCLPDA
jgi:hypothetical protein